MHLRRWLVTLVVCIGIFAGLGFIKFTQVKAAIAFGESFPEPSETVKVIEATPNSWQPHLSVTGVVVPTRSLDIRNELEGMITHIGFESGGMVKKGDVLLQQDISNEQAQLDGLQAEIRIAELDVTRFEALIKSNASSRDQLDRAKAQLAVSEARARALKTTIAKKTLIAPFAGKVGLHRLEAGSFLPANTVITRINGVADKVWIDFQLPQEHANISTATLLNIQSSSGVSTQASVLAVAPEISAQSRNIMVRATLNLKSGEQNLARDFTAGSLVKIDVPITDAQSAILLPNLAIRYDAFGPYVFVLNKDEQGDYRASRKAIKIAFQEDKNTVVKSGLDYGDMVATMGSYKLRSGLLVNVASTDTLGAENE